MISTPVTATSTDDLDVIVIGAGLSGINAAYRLQQQCPGKCYAILEGRAAMGGTWDLFRYPGIRSDSDIFTFGFGFKPWKGDSRLAGGDDIRAYINEAARDFGIDKHIRYQHKVTAADWDSATMRWRLTVEVIEGGAVRVTQMTAGFVFLCSGYYRYDQGYTPTFAGVDDFTGTVVHPQFWPESLDCTDKRVVVIGSGATAVTLIPTLAPEVEHITMLQRTPTWISPVPSRDKTAARLRGKLPDDLVHRIARIKNVLLRVALYSYCMKWPEKARELLLGGVRTILDDKSLVEEHFTPHYNPWDQRVCAAPGGDFFKAINSGKASVVTDHIERFVPEGILLKSGRVVPADVIVTATGLVMVPLGGLDISVDGQPVVLNEHFVWRGTMLDGVPNLASATGYINASWTLRSDLTAQLVCKVLNHLDQKGISAIAPAAPAGLQKRPLLDLSSGYVQRAISQFPNQGDRDPWRMRQNAITDRFHTMRANLNRELRPYIARAAALTEQTA
ncbi:flavin-containing monooxygenase [Mycolicibacterium sp. J2]|uniref:flavin-containing monooxygenase n=1 Tax=Mycolicibacterium sp. J2 TaxID=2993511 RepID=UPI00224B4751|nr:NAD(P)/FAD-dependent oxidoreductase [Mycolicibacterium sp. J2]MCX2715360.1 NAD(P)/FAD-dependent oxidoreductase [Mycolicibacterium sp. J2]